MNQIKEQGQISPGALEDLTVSVAINKKWIRAVDRGGSKRTCR